MIKILLHLCVCSVAQSCPTLWDPVICSPQGSSVHVTFAGNTGAVLPFPTPGDLPDPRIKPRDLLRSPALAGRYFITSTTWDAPILLCVLAAPLCFNSLQPRGL